MEDFPSPKLNESRLQFALPSWLTKEQSFEPKKNNTIFGD
jgi:hypothetical protein